MRTLHNLRQPIHGEEINVATTPMEKLMTIAEIMDFLEFRVISLSYPGPYERVIQDFYIPYQKVTGASADHDDLDVIEDYSLLRNNGFRILGIAHGHGKFQPFHSAKDDEAIEKVLLRSWDHQKQLNHIYFSLANGLEEMDEQHLSITGFNEMDFTLMMDWSRQATNKTFCTEEVTKIKENLRGRTLKSLRGEVSSLVVNGTARDIYAMKRIREDHFIFFPDDKDMYREIQNQSRAQFVREGNSVRYSLETAVVQRDDIQLDGFQVDLLVEELREKVQVCGNRVPEALRKSYALYGREQAYAPDRSLERWGYHIPVIQKSAFEQPIIELPVIAPPRTDGLEDHLVAPEFRSLDDGTLHQPTTDGDNILVSEPHEQNVDVSSLKPLATDENLPAIAVPLEVAECKAPVVVHIPIYAPPGSEIPIEVPIRVVSPTAHAEVLHPATPANTTLDGNLHTDLELFSQYTEEIHGKPTIEAIIGKPNMASPEPDLLPENSVELSPLVVAPSPFVPAHSIAQATTAPEAAPVPRVYAMIQCDPEDRHADVVRCYEELFIQQDDYVLRSSLLHNLQSMYGEVQRDYPSMRVLLDPLEGLIERVSSKLSQAKTFQHSIKDRASEKERLHGFGKLTSSDFQELLRLRNGFCQLGHYDRAADLQKLVVGIQNHEGIYPLVHAGADKHG
ncbi:Mov34/MPN/PAD-1 family protein [Candidatus Woesearchaeota archaeon]|nr:Mov34/MPN/PAD-1 family protein [Candidatus Woesearchaeota archaeon]